MTERRPTAVSRSPIALLLLLLLLLPARAFRSDVAVRSRRKPLRLGRRIRVSADRNGASRPVPSARQDARVPNARRTVLRTVATLPATLAVAAQPAKAGEVGARITEAVTTSDIGISVRTSVVRGAQIMDRIDGRWERFSDRFSLGSERSKQVGRPTPKRIPEPRPLDTSIATAILATTDEVFLELTQLPPSALQSRIQKIATLVRPSFERSGTSLPSVDDNPPSLWIHRFQNGPQFSFASYVHYKAYTELLLEQNVPFAPFLRAFEAKVGRRILHLIMPTPLDAASAADSRQLPEDCSDQERRQLEITECVTSIEQFASELQNRGLVALVDISPLDPVVLEDWIEDSGDLSFSIALDGDITQNAQILIQEQGFRFYPNYGRYGIAALLQQTLTGQKVTVEDYYFDTDYNSDPDKFEVKEVLLNINLESL